MKECKARLFSLLATMFLLQATLLPASLAAASPSNDVLPEAEALDADNSDSASPPAPFPAADSMLRAETEAEYYVTDGALDAARADVQTVHTLEELCAFLAAHPDGGALALGDTITVTQPIALAHLTLDTGAFGLRIADTLTLGENTHIFGDGVDIAVVSVLDGGCLQLQADNTIDVRGNGGTALLLAPSSRLICNETARPTLRAQAPASTALVSDAALDLSHIKLEAASGAAPLQGSAPLRFYQSQLMAEDSVFLPTHFTLDTCALSPSISGGTIVARKLTCVTPSFPLLLRAGEAHAGYLSQTPLRCTLTLSAPNVPDIYEQASVVLQDASIDYDAPAVYTLAGTVLPPQDALYAYGVIDEGAPLTVPLTIYDPNVPYFYDFSQYDDTFFITYYYRGQPEALTLWKSEDNGAHWDIFWRYGDTKTNAFEVIFEFGCFHLCFPQKDTLNIPTLFVFEVGDGIGSDVLYVDASAVTAVGSGGDRDSGDRITLPWEFFQQQPKEDNAKGTDTSSHHSNNRTYEATPPAERVASAETAFDAALHALLGELLQYSAANLDVPQNIDGITSGAAQTVATVDAGVSQIAPTQKGDAYADVLPAVSPAAPFVPNTTVNCAPDASHTQQAPSNAQAPSTNIDDSAQIAPKDTPETRQAVHHAWLILSLPLGGGLAFALLWKRRRYVR